MAKVVPISIDINKGKLPQKPKGINGDSRMHNYGRKKKA